MLCIEYIAFACYPPMSDTSQDRGLVGMFESQELCVLIYHFFGVLSRYSCHRIYYQGDALKETKVYTRYVVYAVVSTGE
jgi:hypothetical protein